MKNRDARLNQPTVHRVEIVDAEPDVGRRGVSVRASRVDREVEVSAITPRVFVVATADPGIARPLIVAAFERNTEEVSIEVAGPFQISGTQQDQLESSTHAMRLAERVEG